MKTLLSLCILAALPVACAPCGLDSVAHTEQEKRAVFTVVLGEGGGISGTWSGYTITGDGVVSSWTGRGARENEQEAGRLPSDTMCVLWDGARSLAATPSVDSLGSLVRYLAVTAGDTVRKHTWRPRLGVNQQAAPYQNFYDRCQSAIRRAMTKTTTTSTK